MIDCFAKTALAGKRPRGSVHRRGGTMAEVVVAVALLGIGISACVGCIGGATRASRRAEELTAVDLLAREKLAEIRTGGVADGENEGDFGEEREGYAWATRAESDPESGLLRVQLIIAWGDPRQPRQREFITFARAGSGG